MMTVYEAIKRMSKFNEVYDSQNSWYSKKCDVKELNRLIKKTCGGTYPKTTGEIAALNGYMVPGVDTVALVIERDPIRILNV